MRIYFLLGALLGLAAAAPKSWNINFPSANELRSRPSRRPFTIAVEGNVGSGKSTLLDYFAKYPDILIFPEPLNIWENMNGTDFLGLALKNPKRWAFTFESLVQLTMVEEHLHGTSKDGLPHAPVKVMERSAHSNRFCFMEYLRSTLEPVEEKVIDEWYRLLMDRPETDLDVDLVVYLRTDPEVVMGRINSRGRQEEDQMQRAFLTGLNRLHDDWLVYKNSTSAFYHPKVIVINANLDISVLSNIYSDLARQVWSSIPDQLRTARMYNH